MKVLLRNGTAAIGVCALLWIADSAKSQIPQKIPTGDQERLVNLELRVSHLEQMVAQIQSGKGSSSANGQSNGQAAVTVTSRVTAPFEVVSKQGKTLLTVKELAGESNLFLLDSAGQAAIAISTLGTPSITLQKGGSAKPSAGPGTQSDYASLDAVVGLQYSSAGQTALINVQKGVMGFRLKKGETGSPTNVSLDLTNGVGNLQIFDGTKQVASLSAASPTGGAALSLQQSSGAGFFRAGASESGGYAVAVSQSQNAASIGADVNGFVGVRAYKKWGGPPSGGITIQENGSAMVYAGLPGSTRAKMGIATTGDGLINVLRENGTPMAYLGISPAGGEVGAANSAGTIVAKIGVNTKTNGGEGSFGDSSGKEMADISGIDGGAGDVCIVRGDKPGKCLGQTVLPLSFGK